MSLAQPPPPAALHACPAHPSSSLRLPCLSAALGEVLQALQQDRRVVDQLSLWD